MENTFPKWLVQSLGGLLVALVALMVVQKAHDVQTTFSNSKPANTIAVSGEGKVQATPDLATINVGVYSEGSSASDIKNQNNTKVNQVIAFIKTLGIADADIKTSEYNLQPKYDYTNGAQKVTGYTLNQSVTVKVHGIDKDSSVVDKIIEGAVNNGANQVDGANLSVENPDALQQQAQDMAIGNAKTKAQALAKAAGITLGKVISVSESSGGYPGPIPYALNSAMGMPSSADVKSIAPTIQTGSQEIDETMTLTYEVK